MSFPRQSVTVAIADTDRGRRQRYERLLQGEFGISLLTDETSSYEPGIFRAFLNRRLKPRVDITACENEVARIKRLKPLVLLVNLNLCTDEDHALLLSLRRECPETLIVLLTEDTVQDNKIIRYLEVGVRGYLKSESIQLHLTTAIQVVGCGEAWVPRKMLGNIMDHMLN